MPVHSGQFWREFKHLFQGLDELPVRSAVLKVPFNGPVTLEIELVATPTEKGFTALTKRYELREIEAEEQPAALEPGGELDVTQLEAEVKAYAWPPQPEKPEGFR